MAELEPPPPAPQRRLLATVDAAAMAERLELVRGRLVAAAATGGFPAPEILVASKYFEASAVKALTEAGATLLGENRAEVLPEKQAAAGDARVQWDYIGELQSRKVAAIAPLVARIHTLASASAVRKLHTLASEGRPLPRLLVQVNVAREAGKGGVLPEDLPPLLALAEGLPVTGLMTMPPLAAQADANRRWFAALAELAGAHGLRELSMGTSQDAVAAAAEGATVVRLGGVLHDDAAWAQFLRDAAA